ncbi:hypothetical protein RIF29_11504 [Crotalaria pallida]|uniref:Uncharacterized protein n=1 Tax=Crotalaria pallida TaxID=3830 RepID=A0AAN9IM66_CROPI
MRLYLGWRGLARRKKRKRREQREKKRRDMMHIVFVHYLEVKTLMLSGLLQRWTQGQSLLFLAWNYWA